MSEKIKEYDLVVIGGGPAGIFGATTAAFFKKSVALVDSHHELGGAGVNTGTAPSKTLRETALALSGMRSRNLYGVDLSLRREATVADFLRHERKVKAGLNAMLARRLEVNQTDVYCGTGAFVDPRTVRVSYRRANPGGDQLPVADETTLHENGYSSPRDRRPFARRFFRSVRESTIRTRSWSWTACRRQWRL